MKKFTLGKTGLQISAVTFGGMIERDVTQDEANRFLARGIERGVNYVDVAPSYGNAEERLSPALKPYRKNCFLACKTLERRADGAKRELLNSLKLLNTDYFDVYQFHAVSSTEDVDVIFGKDGAVETFLWAKREGLIRNIGFSTHNENAAMKAMEMYDFDTVLFPMNWSMGINIGWGDRISEKVKETGAGLLAMKTLIHRVWRDGDDRSKFPKSWCKPVDNEKLGVAGMKYGLYKGAATLIPPGDNYHFEFMLDHIDECLASPLTAEEWELLRTEAVLVKDEMIFR